VKQDVHGVKRIDTTGKVVLMGILMDNLVTTS